MNVTSLAAPVFLLSALILQGCNASNAENPSAEVSADTPSETAEWVPPAPGMKLELTDAQWRDRLTEDQFYILRKAGTEYPFTSPLNDIKPDITPGDFACVGCGNHLFATEHKFDSGTGWPSFDQPVGAKHVNEVPENDLWQRVEVICSGCDGHLGHVFEDGPRATTGLRYCINGDALMFYPRPNAAHPAESSDD